MNCALHLLVYEREHTRSVRQQVVVTAGTGAASLIKELQIADVNGLGLVGIGANQIAMTDVISPRAAEEGDVVLARERIAFGGGQRRP